MSDTEHNTEDENPDADKNWLVVHFIEEDCVEIIPKKWYISNIGESYWPGNSKRIMELIKRCVSPNADWDTYKVKVLGEYDDFIKASKKVVKAKTSDNLSSDNSELRKRKTKRKRCFSSSSECSTDDDVPGEYPPPPSTRKVQKKSNSVREHNLGMLEEKSVNQNVIIQPNNCNTKSNSTNTKSMERNKENSFRSNNNFISPKGSGDDATDRQTEFQKQVFKLLHTINYKINSMQEDLTILIKRKGNSNVAENNIITDDRITSIIRSMPFDSNESMDDLNSLTDVQLKTLSQELSLIGGSNVTETTKTLMYRIMTNKLGSIYTWEGLNGKKSFKSLNISKVIIMAVRLNPKTSGAPELEIIKVIKSWLLRARERLKNSQR